MKSKAPPLKLLLSLVMIILAIALTACHNDDNGLGPDIYQGYIDGIYDKDPYLNLSFFIIEVTKAPDNSEESPKKKNRIYVDLQDFSNMNLKVNQKIYFRIESAEPKKDFPEFCSYIPVHYDWICKIEIVKYN